MKYVWSITFILNIDSKISLKQGLKSVISCHGTGYPDKILASQTRHFGGRVPPARAYRSCSNLARIFFAELSYQYFDFFISLPLNYTWK